MKYEVILVSPEGDTLVASYDEYDAAVMHVSNYPWESDMNVLTIYVKEVFPNDQTV